MVDPVTTVLSVGALACGVAASWYVWPRPPALEGEVWFKSLLSSGYPSLTVPYSPVGRQVEKILTHPEVAYGSDKALEAHRDLRASLIAAPHVAQRWEILFDGSAQALSSAREGLSEDHRPSRWLGRRATWQVAGPEWGTLVAEEEARQQWVWASVGGRTSFGRTIGSPPLSQELVTLVGRLVSRLGWLEVGRTTPSHLNALTAWLRWLVGRTWALEVLFTLDALKALVPETDDGTRLLLWTEGRGTPLALRVLRVDMDLRDRVRGVVSLGGWIGGRVDVDGPLSVASCADWNAHHFRHQYLDTEVLRPIPYLSVQWCDIEEEPMGMAGVSVAAQRFPTPDFVGRETESIEAVDLGIVPPGSETDAAAIRATLRTLATMWVRSRD